MVDFTYCDADALRAERTKAASLAPNQFHKLCPGAHLQLGSTGGGSDGSSPSTYKPFGMPRCGDGSNFSFFFSRPLQQLANDKKILVEFQGGGACWDGDTCGMQQEYLAFPEYYDSFVGLSCSEIEYGAAVQGGNPLSLLCAKQVADTDFREYNTVVVPYCTQDVHIGDAIGVSYDGNNAINHVGAHNMVRTLEWIFANFPNPSHIFLTGCSAGGTAVPIAYDIINKHYNKFGPRSVNINAIMDSSVYLTPEYFLQNGFPNWNPSTIMKKKLRFNFNKYQYSTEYPDLVWNHVLRRGSNRDRWGFVTHSTDPISLMFYQYMSGNGDGEGNRARSLVGESGRQLDNDLQSQWWSETSHSMEIATSKHRNVNTYVINGEGHCSFGLYYPLQEEGFEQWAAPIVKEGIVIGNRSPSVASFLTGLALGGALIFFVVRKGRTGKEDPLIEDANTGEGYLGETAETLAKRVHLGSCLDKVQRAASPILVECLTWPWTAAYLLVTTIYFFGMLISQGFAHPLNNPALGPSAVGLSAFGINNPALVVYKMQHFRLVTSSFLSSGVVTYLLAVFTIYKTALEASMTENKHPHWDFPLVAALISFGSNLIYACVGRGASAGTLALALGLNAFSATMQRRSSGSYPSRLCFTVPVFIVGCSPLFPFDSLVALTSSVVIGVILGVSLFHAEEGSGVEKIEPENVYQKEAITDEDPFDKVAAHHVRRRLVQGFGAAYLLMYLLILFRVTLAPRQNIQPYFTGCNLVYSDQIGDFVSAYANNNGGGRSLDGGEDMFDGEMCAELCIPHLAYRPALWGVEKFAAVPLSTGTCEDNGYEEHIADHTINEFTVTLEVLLYTSSNGDN